MRDPSIAMERNHATFNRKSIVVPPRTNMVFKMALMPVMEDKTSVEIEMPAGAGSSCETVGLASNYSHGSSATHTSHASTAKSRAFSSANSDITGGAKYRGTDAWWSVGDFLQPGIAKQAGKSKTSDSETNDDDTWDLSDSIVDLYKESNQYDGVHNYSPTTRKNEVDVQEWIEQDTNNGFVRVYKTELDRNPKLFPCTLTTTAQKLCIQCGMPPNSLHIQSNGDIIRRLEPFDSPLALQNEYLQRIGYTEQRKIQELGALEDVAYLVKFYAGKPVSDSTYSRNQLSCFAYVRKGKLIYQWVRRLCVITGTRLLIYRDKTKSGKPTIVQLAKGDVEEVQNVKGHDHVLKLTSTLQGERSVYLSFTDEKDYSKWLRKTKKATAKLPTKADLSNCHLEFLPETVFINEALEILNLRHNVLKERPIEEDIYTIGWLDDLPRFICLKSLNLADNSLRCFPMAVCKLRLLTELNLASNRIEDIPPDIADLDSLQMLHLHNNKLTYLPEEMCRMRHLLVLVLAFNHFSVVPNILLQSNDSLLRIDSLIMAGNKIERLPQEMLHKMKHIKKIDFRMNALSLTPSEMAKFHLLEAVTHLDVRDNNIKDLDVRALKCLEYLNCERSKIHSLQVSGGAIKTLLAMQNEISLFSVSPKPEWLATLDLSHNRLEYLPGWLSDCFFLVQLNASHNLLKELPDRLLCDAQKLRVLQLSQNNLQELPREIGSQVLEELSLQHNQLSYLPPQLFKNLPRLKYLCLTNNKLEEIPEPSTNVYQNKLQELYLSANHLGDGVMPVISYFLKLKILHLAYNQVTEIHDRDIRKLENLQELNVSGNFLRHLPRSVGRHGKLQALRCNANLLKELPDFRYSTNLKVLEVGSNRLIDVSVTNLMSSNVNLLDISGNPEMQVNHSELRGIKSKKKVCMVDMKGQNRSLLDLRTAGFDDIQIPWQSGISQTSGIRNKISVMVLNRPKFNEGKEGLFALFDGGRNDEVPRMLSTKIAGIIEEEMKHPITSSDYLKYSLLAAHRKLKSTGQKVGASGAVCHIRREREGSGVGSHVLHVGNVGDTEVVLCRRGEAHVLSRLFTVTRNKEEMQRIHKSGGIITEDNRINGVTTSTRLLGSSYLFPHVIPDPHTCRTMLQPDDQLLIIANQGLWKYLSYQEAIDEIIDIPDPVLAAKKLQDLSQGYRSEENIGVLVVRLMVSGAERNRMRGLLQAQFEREQRLLAELKVRDIEREEIRRRHELEEADQGIPMEIVRLKGGRKRKQIGNMFNGHEVNGEGVNGGGDYEEVDGIGENLTLKKYANNGETDPTSNWEAVLQKRLTEEVKDKELIHAVRVGEEYDPYLPSIESDENWSTTTKLQGQMKDRTITLPPKDLPVPASQPPPAPQIHRRQIIPEASQLSTESLEFRRELKHPLNVDRDAVLFHNMQLTRHRSHNLSTDSIDSTQSDPAYASVKEISQGPKSVSHSIEVLLHGPTAVRAKKLGAADFGGSYQPPIQENMSPPKSHTHGHNREAGIPNGDSCPSDMPMSERLLMLEKKGFLPNSNPDLHNSNPDLSKSYQDLSKSDPDLPDSDQDQQEVDDDEHQMKVDEAEIDSFFKSSDRINLVPEPNVSQRSDKPDLIGDIVIEVIDANGDHVGDDVKDQIEAFDAESGKHVSGNNSFNDGHSSGGSSEIVIMKNDHPDDLSELYATVKKVRHGKDSAKPAIKDKAPEIAAKAPEIPAKSPEIPAKASGSKVKAPDIYDKTPEIRVKVSDLKNKFSAMNDADKKKSGAVSEQKSSIDNAHKQSVKPEPLSIKPEPHNMKPEPHNVKPEPYSMKSKPHSVKPEPQSVKPEPQSVKPEPQSVKPEPQNVKPEPLSVKSEPLSIKPEPHYVKPEPHTTKPEPHTTNQGPLKQTIFIDNKITEPKSTHHRRAPKPPQAQLVENIKSVNHTDQDTKAPPIPPRIPLANSSSKTDMNSNSIKSLEDLLAYNRLQQQQHQQHQHHLQHPQHMVSFKTMPKVAPPPPTTVAPPTDPSMVPKSASQRSVVITYL